MPKIFPVASSHSRYSDFFRNLHDGGGFVMEVVKMGVPVERPIEIRTLAIVLEFFLTHAHFAVSLQDAMAIILERSQEENSQPRQNGLPSSSRERHKAKMRKLWWTLQQTQLCK
jgi:hypothetical protein